MFVDFWFLIDSSIILSMNKDYAYIFDFMFWFFMYIACLCNHYFLTLLVGCISSKIMDEFMHGCKILMNIWMTSIHLDVIHPFFNCICLYNMYVLWYKLCIVFILKLMWMSSKIRYISFVILTTLTYYWGHTLWKRTPNNNPLINI
jgi:hypothetical protein